MAAGATSVAEPADQLYGDRLARITDPHGNQWSISTHIKDLTPDQIAERIAAMGRADSQKNRWQRFLYDLYRQSRSRHRRKDLTAKAG